MLTRDLFAVANFSCYLSINVQNVICCVGVIGIIWAIMWFFLVYNSPATHPRISPEEREYIEKALHKKADDKVQKSNLMLKFHSRIHSEHQFLLNSE